MVSASVATPMGQHRNICKRTGSLLSWRQPCGVTYGRESMCVSTQDNEAVVTTIQRRSAKHPLLTQLLRCLFFYASVFQFHFSASHIPGVFNTTADAISRNNLELLPSLLPQASQQVTVPQSVSGFLLALPDWGSPNWTTLFLHLLPRAYPLLPRVATAQESTGT